MRREFDPPNANHVDLYEQDEARGSNILYHQHTYGFPRCWCHRNHHDFATITTNIIIYARRSRAALVLAVPIFCIDIFTSIYLFYILLHLFIRHLVSIGLFSSSFSVFIWYYVSLASENVPHYRCVCVCASVAYFVYVNKTSTLVRSRQTNWTLSRRNQYKSNASYDEYTKVANEKEKKDSTTVRGGKKKLCDKNDKRVQWKYTHIRSFYMHINYRCNTKLILWWKALASLSHSRYLLKIVFYSIRICCNSLVHLLSCWILFSIYFPFVHALM